MQLRISTLCILTLLSTAVLANETTVSVGGDLSVFDNPRSQQGSMPLDLAYHVDDWTLEGTDTYFYREGTPTQTFRTKHGPQLILVPIHVGNRTIWVPRPRKPIPGEPTAWGWGDLSLNATYAASIADEHHVGVDLIATATLPTGSRSRNFSTGTTEYAFGATLTKIVGSMTYTANAIYNLNGDIPGAESEDGWATQLSGIYTSAHGHTIGLQYNWAQAASLDVGTSRVLEVISSFVLSKQNKLAFTVGHGFGLNDPITDVNATLSHTF
jgi:hypothetical protein